MKRLLTCGLVLWVVASTNAGAARYGLFVGLNEYSYIASDNFLSWCVADAVGLRTNLISHGGGWAATNTTLLTNSLGSKVAIRAALSNYAAKAVSGDVVVYFHSSHGGNDDLTQADVYLCSYNADYTEDELAADLSAFAAGVKVIVIVDACHSGGLFMETAALTPAEKKARREAARNWDLAERVTARMTERRLARLAAGDTRAIRLVAPEEIGWMTACAYYEYSYEDDSISHGWFTHRLLQGFDYGDGSGDGWATFQELFDFAALRIPYADQIPQSLNPAILATTAGTAGATPAGDAWDYLDNVPDNATLLTPAYQAFQTHGAHALRQELDESDFFAVPVMKNRCYTFRSTNLSGDVDAELYTWPAGGDPQLIRTAYDIDYPADLNFEMVYKAAESGTVFLKVKPSFDGTTTGAYSLVYANAGTADSMDTLSNGVPVTIAAIDQDAYDMYRVPVPAGQTNLTIRLTVSSGDPDLYVGHGYWPLTDDDYNSQTTNSIETISITDPPAGEWFIQVYGYDPSSNMTLRATFTPGGSTIAAATGTAAAATFAVDLTNGARVSIYSATNHLPTGHWNWALRSNAATVVNGKVSLNLISNAPGQIISVGKPLDF